MPISASTLAQASSGPFDAVKRGARELAVLAAVLAAGLLILLVVATWLVAAGLAGDQLMERMSVSVIGDAGMRDRWSITQCFLFGVGLLWPVVPLLGRWLSAHADPHAAEPVWILGVGLRPGPVSITTGVLCGVAALALWAGVSGGDDRAWRGALVLGAVASGIGLVWRAGATVGVAGRRAYVLWVASGLIVAGLVGGLVSLL
jgi:hypothetical protein